jgi:hypothetical protein
LGFLFSRLLDYPQHYPQRALIAATLLKETVMLRHLFVVGLATFAGNAAYAANPACEAQATEKKLSGAAKNSFVTKCEKDATAAATKTCDAQAAEKKLSGAAKTSFTKKCVSDASGAAK